MRKSEELQRFERIVMSNLGAGYNLARWLTRNDNDAQDVLQESYLRAWRGFDRYRGGDSRAWILTIVRNTCYTWLRQNRSAENVLSDDSSPDRLAAISADPSTEPEARFIHGVDQRQLREALEALPAEFREALVLRELEGLSYKEIADIIDAPLGTVMSRLARARAQLQRLLSHHRKERNDEV